MDPSEFPIAALLPRIRDSLDAHPRLVLEAPPGAGKTTQVPLALLHAPWLRGNKIVMLEPRRVAARAAAGFMAQQLRESVGGTVGYRIRFDNKVSARTRIEVVTEGILTRMLQDDPTLDGIGAVLFDEFHERHLAGDLGLALALDVQTSLRDDLRIVLMSATLDGERLAQRIDARRLSSAGRSYPVETAHVAARRDETIEAQARRAVEQALTQHPGDVLVFLPGQREIARVEALLGHRGEGGNDGVGVLQLHGELPVERQAELLQPDPNGRRRVVLATNVAESSVTLPAVRVVVDSGLAREPRYDPNSGFSRLETVNVSQASADQRAGRAGRVAAGWAYRLWPASQRLESQRRPEIAQVELAGLALELAAWGRADLTFVDAPPAGALSAARDLLRRLGALNHADSAIEAGIDAERPSPSDRITPLGRRMLALGMHPRLAAMLLASDNAEQQALACDVVALVEARDPLRAQAGAPRSDALAARWRGLSDFREGRAPVQASRSALEAIAGSATQWRRRLRIDAQAPRDAPPHALGDLLAHAFPDRIARRHATDARRYQLANGRIARLFDDSELFGEPWIVASELRYEAKDALIVRGAPLDEAYLRQAFAASFSERDEVRWDAPRRALVAERVQRFDGIVLDARPAGRIEPGHASRALTDAAATLGIGALPWSDALRQWRARAQSLRAWIPELGLPDLSDAALLETREAWLLPAFTGKTRFDALDQTEFAEALKACVDWTLRQRIEQLAPARIVVPSGQERRIEYAQIEDGASPVLAVKLQELFGLADTPRIAEGRVPLTVHLLSPAGRPLQVTQDLRGFWERTYPDVKKEMKARYPKHPWPDDPWNTTPTHRAKLRGER